MCYACTRLKGHPGNHEATWGGKSFHTWYTEPEIALEEALTVLKDIAQCAHHKTQEEYCDCACCKARKLLGVAPWVDHYVP